MNQGVGLTTRQRALLLALNDPSVVDEFTLYFQPLLACDRQLLPGVEALIRWRHPQFGWVSPAEFIPLAEQQGVIKPITTWVIQTAVETLSRWAAQGIELCISVNVSAVDVEQGYLLELLLSELERSQLRVDQISLEVTETMAFRSESRAIHAVQALRGAGFSVALDDFGSGHAGLRQLGTLPVNRLKIDRSWVQSAHRQAHWKQLLQGVVSMAHELGLDVVAEGVDNAQTCLVLEECGCDYLQGYYFASPLSEQRLLRWLQHQAILMTAGRNYPGDRYRDPKDLDAELPG